MRQCPLCWLAMNEEYIEILRSFQLLEEYTNPGLSRFVETGEFREIKKGTIVFNEGEHPKGVLLLVRGTLEVFVMRQGKRIKVNNVEPGHVLGEMAVLCALPRTSSVCTEEDSVVLFWDSAAFLQLLTTEHFFAQKVFARTLRMMLDREKQLIDVALAATRKKHSS
jgi:CRP-like cAMP-binding protein